MRGQRDQKQYTTITVIDKNMTSCDPLDLTPEFYPDRSRQLDINYLVFRICVIEIRPHLADRMNAPCRGNDI